jgi:hypothetical protein
MPVYLGVVSKQAGRMKATENTIYREIEELSDRERVGQTAENKKKTV